MVPNGMSGFCLAGPVTSASLLPEREAAIRVLKFALRAVGLALIVIGALVVFRWSIVRFFPDAPTRDFVSPNGLMKAVLVVRAGGGGFSPYCNSSVYVVPGGEAALTPDFEVFYGDCATLQEIDGQVTWLSDQSLRIRISALSGEMTFRHTDKSGQVRVDFVLGR